MLLTLPPPNGTTITTTSTTTTTTAAWPRILHYFQATVPDNDGNTTSIVLDNIRDCEVEIRYRNDSNLLVEARIDLYTAGVVNQDFSWFAGEHPEPGIEPMNWIALNDIYEVFLDGEWTLTQWQGGVVRIQRVLLILGTGQMYRFHISGENLNTTVCFSSGALLGAESFLYEEEGTPSDAQGSFEAILEPEVNFTLGGIDIDASNIGEITAVVMLPMGINGRVWYNCGSVTIDAAIGWTKHSVYDLYYVGVEEEPLFDLSVSGGAATFFLVT